MGLKIQLTATMNDQVIQDIVDSIGLELHTLINYILCLQKDDLTGYAKDDKLDQEHIERTMIDNLNGKIRKFNIREDVESETFDLAFKYAERFFDTFVSNLDRCKAEFCNELIEEEPDNV